MKILINISDTKLPHHNIIGPDVEQKKWIIISKVHHAWQPLSNVQMRVPGRQQICLEINCLENKWVLWCLSVRNQNYYCFTRFSGGTGSNVGGQLDQHWSAFAGSSPLLTCSSFLAPRASYLLRRDTLVERGWFLLLP